MTDKKIQVYGTTWCPDCHQAKNILKKRDVAYEWYDIGEDDVARTYVEKMNKGYRSVPTIIFPDGSILVEPGNAELENKLAELEKVL